MSSLALPLHERLKARREELMLSQVEAARELGISRRLYQLYEAGEQLQPRPQLRRRIAAWLGDGSVEH